MKAADFMILYLTAAQFDDLHRRGVDVLDARIEMQAPTARGWVWYALKGDRISTLALSS